MQTLRFSERSVTARALLFDKDGTLVDFHSLWPMMTGARIAGISKTYELSEAEIEALSSQLGMLGPGRIDPYGPLPLSDPTDQMVLMAGFLYARRQVPFDEAKRRASEAFDEAWTLLPEGSLRLLPQVEEMLREMRKRGWLIGLVTNDGRRETDFVLKTLGIAELFDAVAYGGRVEVIEGRIVKIAKPNPEMIYGLTKDLGVGPSECVLIGDGHNDLKMGRTAGCVATIGVLSGCDTQEQLLSERPDVIVDGVGVFLNAAL